MEARWDNWAQANCAADAVKSYWKTLANDHEDCDKKVLEMVSKRRDYL